MNEALAWASGLLSSLGDIGDVLDAAAERTGRIVVQPVRFVEERRTQGSQSHRQLTVRAIATTSNARSETALAMLAGQIVNEWMDASDSTYRILPGISGDWPPVENQSRRVFIDCVVEWRE